MCGICGIYHPDSGIVDKNILSNMTNILQHRGPDDVGYYIEPNKIGLGHRRLSIIDLQSGKQPISNEDNTIFIVYNGECYNFLQLRDTLIKKGHKFKTRTDTEVIIHLYEEYGTDCLQYLCGMFSFAIWDRTNNTLFLARDRTGQKPLVYYSDNNTFLFASEIKSILKYGIDIKENYEAIHHYLTFQCVPSPLTAYKNILKLPPGHFLINKNGNIKIERYWNPDFNNQIDISFDDACNKLRDIMFESVKLRLISDVSLGAFLSGGIDSSIVVGIMSKLTDEPVKTFSIGFDEEDFDEVKYARTIADKFHTDHKEFVVKPNAIDIIDKLVWHYNEPFADPSAIPTYYVSKITREHVKVALSGDGGDESFAGYNRYIFFRNLLKLRKIPGNQFLFQLLKKILPVQSSQHTMLGKLKRLSEVMIKDPIEQYTQLVGHFSNDRKYPLYTAEFKDMVDKNDSTDILRQYYKSNNTIDSFINNTMYADLMNYLPEDVLTKVDIASMAVSLECRSPFLDHNVIEFAASLPFKYKLNGNIKKYILKRTFNDILTDDIINRNKQGFGVPIGHWFRNELKELVFDTLLSEKFKNRNLFKPEQTKSILDKHDKKIEDNGYRIWDLLMLELWFRKFIDQ